MITPTRSSAFFYLRRKAANGLMWVFASGMTLLALIPLFLVLYYLLAQGLPGLNLDFFTQLPKPPGEAGGGMANAIIGSLVLVALASLLGLPIGLLGGIYLAEFGNNRVAAAIRFFADVLASVPSIVIGMLIYTVVVLTTKQFSAIAGGLALAVMMIPTVMRTTEELVRMVPMAQREASLSLGVTHARTVFSVVMVAARPGVITGVLLAIARVAGETAPLLFTAFGSRLLFDITQPAESLGQPIASLPVQIYNYAIAPYDDWHQQAWTGALVLVLFILGLSVLARVTTRGRHRLVR